MIPFVIAAFVSYFVKGLCGFANMLVFGSILSFSVDNIDISPIGLILGLPANMVMTWKNRQNLNWRIWAPIAVLVLLGNIPGTFLLQTGDAKLIKILFGVAIILIGIEMLYREYSSNRIDKAPNAKRGNKAFLMFIGLISGVLCGLYGVAVLLAVYMSRVTDNDSSFKANMCAVLITENIFRVIAYGIAGILSLQNIGQAMMLFPVMAIGLWLGMKCSDRLNKAVAKKIVVIMILLSGVSLVVTNLI